MKSTVKTIPRKNVGGSNNGIFIETELLQYIDLPSLYMLQVINQKLIENYGMGRGIRDGRVWMFQSVEDFSRHEFEFYSTHTIYRKLNWLVENGILIRCNKYNKLKYDKTYWYTIDYDVIDKLRNESEMKQQLDSSTTII